MKRRNFNVGIFAGGVTLTTGVFAEVDNSFRSLLHLATHKNGLGSNEHRRIRDLEHSFNFNLDEMHEFANQLACILISHHGSFDEVPPGWEKIELGLSGWPIYSGHELGVTSLTREQLTLILSGRISNWSELGGREQSITVITNHRLEFKGMRAVMFENHVLRTIPRPEALIKAIGYRDILRKAREIKGSLIIGLRRYPPVDLTPIAIDGHVYSLDRTNQYPLQLRTNVLIRSDSERASHVLHAYLREMAHEKNIDETIVANT